MWRKASPEAKSTVKYLACALAAAGLTFLSIVFVFGGFKGFKSAMKFAEINRVIDEYYIGEADTLETSEAAYAAQVWALGDRWSYYLDTESYASFKSYSDNQAIGMGVYIAEEPDGGGILITGVSPGSPAERAGILAGDVILSVGGQSTLQMGLGELTEVVRDMGTEEFSLLLRGEDGKEREVSIRRESYSVEPVEYRMLEGEIGYIKLLNFESGAGQKAIDAVKALMDEGAGALLFDVRGNPGGQLRELTRLLDFLLPEGDIFVSVGKDGNEEVTRSDEDYIELPMAVLINKDSYSAAEFFAAALGEYGLAFTVGENTTGKARSQITVTLSDGSAVHISSRRYLTPNRVDLSEQGGLKPDFAVEMEKEGDTQLDYARERLSLGLTR